MTSVAVHKAWPAPSDADVNWAAIYPEAARKTLAARATVTASCAPPRALELDPFSTSRSAYCYLPADQPRPVRLSREATSASAQAAAAAHAPHAAHATPA